MNASELTSNPDTGFALLLALLVGVAVAVAASIPWGFVACLVLLWASSLARGLLVAHHVLVQARDDSRWGIPAPPTEAP